ncbi:DUF460 domain-containing protein [Hyperthermus butylicus]|uniref:Conserved archaeal protein n=1 Tax=Hyperthermus butylicus (strain DSM 5456 / JCM 9403 / PLM1-5) TaxID=415426 RepID=A2BIZ7_HYPBU|nr:DUF460 domain-containing protein [Hyperthermus butylicus]ABM79958.1 conserved archaeal protein [Hyperthermus butylicus DSM 5456]
MDSARYPAIRGNGVQELWGGLGTGLGVVYLRVIGVDVEPGCRNSGRCYSVAVLDGDKLLAKYEGIPLHRLIRIIWEYKPDILAVDNIAELAETEHELAKLASMLPAEMAIVQVTRLPDGSFVDVRRLARLAGLDPGSGKLTPSRTAYLVAVLASMGYGSRVRFVEEKTKIVISRSRRLKHGGMSNPRFQRRIRAAILRAMKDVKKLLDKHKLDYDLMIRKSGGGLDSAVFIVYASRPALNGIIKPYEDNDVRIEVKPIYSSKLVFETTHENIAQPKPYIIIGIDPGISTGVAIIDIHGRFVTALSRRGFDRSEVIDLVLRYGVPVLVATDVRPAPEFVKKLAAALGVPVYEPSTSLSVEEKRTLFDSYAQKYPVLRRLADAHVRDALAAAVKAYQVYEPKLRQVESYAARLGIDIDVDRVKADVIRGVTIAEAVEKAINEALNDIMPNMYLVKSVRRDHEEAAKQQPAGEKLEKLRVELERLRAENKLLRQRLAELDEVIERVETEYRLLQLEYRASIERDREINRLANEVSLLRSELERTRMELEKLQTLVDEYTRALFLVAKGAAVPALAYGELNSDTVREVEEKATEYGRIVLVLDTVNPVHWKLYGQKVSQALLAVLLPGQAMDKRSVIEEYMVPVLPAEEYIVFRHGRYAVVDSRVLLDAYLRKQALLEERQWRGDRKTLTKDELKKLISEYRARRAKLLLENSNLALNE